MLCETRMMYFVEIRDLYDEWKEAYEIHGRFCEKVLWTPMFVANGMAELEMGGNSRGGKV